MKTLFALLVLAFVVGCSNKPSQNTAPSPAPSFELSHGRAPNPSWRAEPDTPWLHSQRQPPPIAKPHLFTGPAVGGGGARPPIIPQSWTIAAWNVDPANSTTCANDFNNCTQSTCGAAGAFQGPCVTFAEIAARWGTYSPRIRQNTTITFQSSQSGNSDPVYLTPFLENGAQMIVQGTLGAGQQIASGTLGVVTSKNRATNQNLVAASMPAGSVEGALVVNSTHPSRAWIFVPGPADAGVWQFTQPLVALTLPVLLPVTEVDTWATGDSVTVFQPVAVDIVYVAPVVSDNNGTFTNALFLYQLNVLDPAGATSDSALFTTPNFAIVESRMDRIFEFYSATSLNAAVVSTGLVNVDMEGGVIVSPSQASTGFLAGMISKTAFIARGPLDLNADVSLGISVALNGVSSNAGNVFLGVNTVTLSPQTQATTSGNDAINGGPVIYGSGSVNVTSGVYIYPPGAGAAAAYFKTSGGILMKTSSKVCLAVPSAATSFGTCNITLSAANLDANLGATSGCLAVGGGPSYCNF